MEGSSNNTSYRGALGTIEENCKKELQKIPGKPRQYEVQKIVINGRAHKLKKILG